MGFFRVKMSSHDEIMAVYNDEIAEKSRLVESRFGKAPFYDYFDGFRVCEPFTGLGIERITCSEFTPKRKKWSRKPFKSLGEKE